MINNLNEVVAQFKQLWTAQLDDQAIAAICRQAGMSWRQTVLTPIVTIKVFFLQILHGNTACAGLRHLARLAFSGAAYCDARMRIPLSVFQSLLEQTATRMKEAISESPRWRGHRLFYVDGSGFSMPDKPALQKAFGQPTGQKPGGGFPVAHFLLLMHAATGTSLRHLKITMKMDVLKCMTVDGVLKELAIFVLIYNLVRLVMVEASRLEKVEVERISFIDALRWLVNARPGDRLCHLVVNPQRPNRYAPRVKKRRPKAYPLMTRPRKELKKDLAA